MLIRTRKCERCEKEFLCGTAESCWCFEFPPINIEKGYKDCVCKECLKELYEASKNNS